jgi:hypothetical protein
MAKVALAVQTAPLENDFVNRRAKLIGDRRPNLTGLVRWFSGNTGSLVPSFAFEVCRSAKHDNFIAAQNDPGIAAPHGTAQASYLSMHERHTRSAHPARPG